MKPLAMFPSLTDEWHNASYDAISPSNPSLSVANKTVVITGAGRGIGAATVRAFAQAGASHIALVGRTSSNLSDTKSAVSATCPSVHMTIHTADVADTAAMTAIAKEIGGWDVLILNAGRIGKSGSVGDAEPDEWWGILETNIKGNMVTSHAFLPLRKKDAIIIGVSANMITMKPDDAPCLGASSYICSKMAQIKLLEYLAAENTDLCVVSVHPGVIETDSVASMREHDEVEVDNSFMDDIKLPAHFFVWLASSKSRFLNGKFVCANWDVDQLKAKADKIKSTPILTGSIHGWPYESL